MKFTHMKLVMTPREAELFIYEQPVFYGFQNKKPKNTITIIDPEKQLENRKRSLYRSKIQLRRLINANTSQWASITGRKYKPLFLTLTFKEEITDLETANYEFTKFVQRLNYMVGYEKSILKYIVVPEIQRKREEKYGVGVWHFHLILFNMPFVEKVYDRLNQIWANGFMLLKDLEGIKNIGAYMSKYMSKDKSEPKLIGHKTYFTSKGLYKPLEYKDEKTITKILESFPKDCPVIEKDYISEYHGNIKSKKYQLNL